MRITSAARDEGAGRARLVNTADNSSRRRSAYETRTKLWELSSLPRVRNCGRVPVGPSGGAVIKVHDGKAGIGGLQTCGSPWACPVCSRKISAERSREIVRMLEGVPAAALVTLTVRHARSDLLDEVWDAVTAAWSAVTSGAGYKKDREQFGVTGWVRAVEVTHGEAGWHVHVHALVCFDAPTSLDLMEQLGVRMFLRWERALSRRGFEAVADRGGLDVRQVQMGTEEKVASYLAKIGLEMTSPKTGRMGNRTPFQILREGIATGNADDLDLWWVWEKVSYGRKQLTWSRNIRVKTDDEIAAQDHGGDVALILPKETWVQVRHVAIELLEAVEAGLGEEWLRSRRLDFQTVYLSTPDG